MSPAVMDVQSPLTSPPQMQPKQQQSFTPQNPNPNPLFPFDSGSNLPEQHQSSNLGFSLPFVPRMSSEKSNSSAVSGRSKPRLVKIRRQKGSQQGKSSNNSGLKPFQSVLENSNQVNNATSSSSNGFNSLVGDVGFVFGSHKNSLMSNLNSEKEQCTGSAEGFGSFNNVGFVFGVNKSNWDSNLHSEHKESSGGVGELGANVGFVFGANKSSSLTNSDLERRPSSGNVQQLGADEFGELNYGGFVFGAKKSNSVSNKNSEQRASNGSEGQMHADEFRKFDSVQFGSKPTTSVSSSNFEAREPSVNVEIFGEGGGTMKEENKAEFRKLDDQCFVFSGDLMSNSNLKKKESHENVEKSASDVSGKMKLDFGKLDNTSFVLGGNWSELTSNFDSVKGESNENGGKSVPIGSQKMKLGAQLGLSDNVRFNSSACLKSSSSISDFQKRESSESSGKSDFEDVGKMKVDIEVGSVVNNKDNFVFGSSVSSTSASGTSTSHKLTDEMKKLTVDDCGKTECSDNAEDPNINSYGSSNHVFVFGSDKSPPGFCTGKARTTSYEQVKDANLKGPGNASAVEKTEGVNFRTIDENVFVFSSSIYAAGSFGGGERHVMPTEKDKNTSGLGVFDGIKLGCPFGSSWEEKQPANVDEKSSNGPSVSTSTPKPFTFQAGLGKISDGPQDQLNDDTNLNKTSNQSLFSSSGLRFEVPSMGRFENKDKFSFTSTPVGLGASTTDFRTLNRDASCSFTANLYNGCAPSAVNATSSTCASDEDLAAAREGPNTSEDDKKCRGKHEEVSKNHYERFVAHSSLEEAETECSNFKSEQKTINRGGGVAEDSVNSDRKREESECVKQFCFASSVEDISVRNFTFSVSSAQDNFSVTKRQNLKKYRMKVGHGPNCTTPSQKVDTVSSSVQSSPLDSGYLHRIWAQDKEGDIISSQRKGENKSKGGEEHDKGSTAATLEACEKWRIRGNQAYEKGYRSEAEEFYTKGINCVLHSEKSGCCVEPLVLCYSNRAAARMSRGRMREALGDCMMAASLDPTFHKVQIRAANCHLALGEVEDALQYFSKCVESGSHVCLDRRIIIEAANGLQNAQKVAKCMNQCAELLRERTSNAANSALEIISQVLSISSYSEKLLEMKGEALLMLQRYEEVIQLCEQTLVFAEKNFAMVTGDNNIVNVDGLEYKNSSIKLWRWLLISKSYFYLGRLDEALDLLEKQELLRSTEDRHGSSTRESSIPFAVTVRELLHRKNAGNEAFQSGRHTEAVEHYTAVVSCSIESRPFAAICFCNRAAAHQSLGQIADAIADCSLAIALDGSYSKAVSRRATLHETIRDYEQAASDLHRLISLLEKQSQEKVQQCGSPDGSAGGNVKELRQAHRRLSSVEEKAKKGISLDHYLILGIKPSDAASEIKKAYRKAALRHHPDKAGQFLARSESGDDGQLWKEIADEVHKDADRLFKMIGEAYAVLSDPTKRSHYDLQEELRNAQKESNGSRASRGPSDYYSSPFDGSASRRYWKQTWKTYGNSRSQF
ncbi:hypothetical protein HYC85_022374 [Camellia sinensis]|uniref:J domain-containing protein n=1 Tax=Camellia sinensis TaxID=4442 RepID=A0A7J7GL47_CAMSI|nr:hypothetical protein HYC85_022374 [Camellia sinensis]